MGTLKTKSQVFEIFRKFHVMVERKIKRNWSVFDLTMVESILQMSLSICPQHDIRYKKIEPDRPQHNGVAERMNRTIVEKVRCMLRMYDLLITFWVEAMQWAMYLINRYQIPLDLNIPERAWRDMIPLIHISESLAIRHICMCLKNRGQSLIWRIIHVFLLSMKMKSMVTGSTIHKRRRWWEAEMWYSFSMRRV